MEKLIYLFVILSFTPLQAQKIITAKYFDKDKKILFEKDHISKWHNYNIKLSGVNTSVHKVIFTFEDYNLVSEPPDIIKSFLPGLSDFGLRKQSIKDSCKDYYCRYNRLKLILCLLDSIRNDIIEISKAKSIKTEFFDSCLTRLCNYYGINDCDPDRLYAKVKYDIDYIIFYYESLSEFKESFTHDEYVKKLTFLNSCYDEIRQYKSKILDGINAVTDGIVNKPSSIEVSDIHQPAREITKVDIVILDKFNLQDTLGKYQKEIYSTGLLKIDFSTGLGFNNLVDSKYYLSTLDSVNFVKEEDTDQLDFGVTGLVHFNWKLTSCFAIGPVTGISVSLFNGQVRYLIGASCTFGKVRSVSISGGVSFGKVSVLSSLLSSDGKNIDQPIPNTIESIPMTDRIKPGYYFSLSYNLSRTKE